MTTSAAFAFELPDGYTVCERIGSGGYGEVWRAIAPGGVEKAVKVVFGHCSEDLAERELKSLERIRSVRHPFVISLERFEIVSGRLIIVTELADKSLDACFREYQAAGEPGIPRDELLNYLSDAADALDCLVERHALQHLDIKPENLLVVGDHVKVGDFGLVKELATRTLNSMMGGMTPLYSAPEVFDDAPSPRSDQYSLAIVYQQMLTGQMPFPGRTPAQLAKQHTQAEPNLQSLRDADRAIVRRALAKKPEARFASCRDFIAALVSGSTSPAAKATPAAVPGRSDLSDLPNDDDTKSIAGIHTQPIGKAAPDDASGASHGLAEQISWPPTCDAAPLDYPAVSDKVVDLALPHLSVNGASTKPTLIVAVGGLGITMLMHTRERIARCDADQLGSRHLAWLAIDTDRESLNAASIADGAGRLDSADTLHIPLKRPKQYRDGSQNLLRWVSRRWLYNIPRSLETRGYRPLGRIAVVDHAEAVLGSLYTRLQQLATIGNNLDQVRVILLAGSSGGTGSGTLIDLAQAVRSLASDLAVEVEVHTIIAMPERVAGTADSLSIANSYSLLTELAQVQRQGNRGGSNAPGPATRYDADAPAFDDVYLVTIPARTFGDERMQKLAAIADYLSLNLTNSQAAETLSQCRELSRTAKFRLRSLGCAKLHDVSTMSQLIDRVTINLLACGYSRHALLFTPDQAQLPSECVKEWPALSVIETPIAAPVMIAEAADIDPLSIAARLAESYPDIAEAASRLHAREDIQWQDLRAVEAIAAPCASQAIQSDPVAVNHGGQATIKRLAPV